jgi:hypothetical protein
MLAEEGDDLSAIEVPKDLGPEGSGSSAAPAEGSGESSKASENKPEEPVQTKSEPKGTEQKTAGGGHREIHHPKPLFPSVSRL